MRDFKTVPMPPQIAQRPRDKRGYPIPFSNIVYPDGTPDFTAMDMEKWIELHKGRRCGICGLPMHGRVWFVGGPLCAPNRLFFDHPMHKDCATYALQVCPFLALPAMHYRKRPPEEIRSVDGATIATTVMQGASDEKPKRFMLGKTKGYDIVRHNGEVYLRAMPWDELTWWENGSEVVDV